MASFRGKVFHVAGEDGSSEIIGGATMIEGIILAASKAPNNPHIEHVREHGIRNTVLFRPYTPDDVFTCVQQEANAWQLGSCISLAELYDSIPTVEAGWEAFKLQHGARVPFEGRLALRQAAREVRL